MSCALKAIKDMVSAGVDDAAKDAAAQIDLMEELVKQKMKSYYSDIGNEHADPKLLPIDKVLYKYEYIACTYESKDSVGDLITGAVKDFADGPVGSAIANLAKNIIGSLLGQASAAEKTETKYAISINSLGGISRLDAWFYVRQVSASALTSKKATIVACIVVQSSVNVDTINSNTLKVLFHKCFTSGGAAMPPLLLKAVYAQLAPSILKLQTGAGAFDPPTAEEKEALDKWYKENTPPAPPPTT